MFTFGRTEAFGESRVLEEYEGWGVCASPEDLLIEQEEADEDYWSELAEIAFSTEASASEDEVFDVTSIEHLFD